MFFIRGNRKHQKNEKVKQTGKLFQKIIKNYMAINIHLYSNIYLWVFISIDETKSNMEAHQHENLITALERY